MDYLSAAEVESLSDEDLDYAVFHHVLHRLSHDGADWSEQEVRIAFLPSDLRRFYAMWTVELQVHNGGFNQFFFNCGDVLVWEAVQGYQNIGAMRLAEITNHAADAYKVEQETQERTKSLVETDGWQAFADSYNQTALIDFDTPFYRAEREEHLKVLRAKFLRQYPERFDLFQLETCWDRHAGDDPTVLNQFGLPTQKPGWIDPCPLNKR
ncbi:MAG: DUF4375 domain-containing protein [Armatimonadota bacterium]